MMEHEKEALENMAGGSNSEISLFKRGDKKFISKTYKNTLLDYKVANLLVADYLEVRAHFIKNDLKIPEIEEFLLQPGLLRITEEFAGLSIKNLTRRKNNNLNKYIEDCLAYIKRIPTDIPVDTNPGNFTVKHGGIYFVDFMPPLPWKYRKEKFIQSKLEKIFPTLKPRITDKDKIKRYYKEKDRIEKFLFYLGSYKTDTKITLSKEA